MYNHHTTWPVQSIESMASSSWLKHTWISRWASICDPGACKILLIDNLIQLKWDFRTSANGKHMRACNLCAPASIIYQLSHVQSSYNIQPISFSIPYTQQGGQFILNLVDFYGTSFIVFILSIGSVIAVSWIYGIINTHTQISLICCNWHLYLCVFCSFPLPVSYRS